MEKQALHVSIIGGGIGGLATASALQHQGIEVTVFERNSELREIGAGLTLWANGVQVLRQLGLLDALMAVSAHPPTPNLGQGACQALEDALVLADCLAGQREPVAALRAYEARRKKRSATIIKQSALFGKIGQWEQPLLCSLRDGFTPLAFTTFFPRLFLSNVSIPS